MIHALLDCPSLLANDSLLDSMLHDQRSCLSVYSEYRPRSFLPSFANRHDRALVNNSKALDVRIFQTGCSSCGGGIGSSVRSFRLEGRKERRKRGTRGTRGQVDMDGWIWVDGHMGEHFRGTGGR
ncbi:hypothetical protein DBV15_02421 [Temnothorax longispinosus]|uniref:Uncharacterized protein n=1 Tax=Temnothorax longispinosus TaxID=300112 RepID=A0A4S2KVS8_9HYME|nr:hypothetical protein DBV15_02421 [Temnothorax longispinosus]